MARRPAATERHALLRVFRARNRDAKDEGGAREELTALARVFSQRTRAVVDNQLPLLAALLRAGELQEANRILAEAEKDLRESQAALFERINEHRAAGAAGRGRRRRLPAPLGRALAVALVGSLVSAFSVFGVSFVRDLQESTPSGSREAATDAREPRESGAGAIDESRVSGARYVRVGGMRVLMTPAQFKTYKKLISGKVDKKKLEQFLLSVLDSVSRRQVGALVTALAEAAERSREDVERAEPAARAEADGVEARQRREAHADAPAPPPAPAGEPAPDQAPPPPPAEDSVEEPAGPSAGSGEQLLRSSL